MLKAIIEAIIRAINEAFSRPIGAPLPKIEEKPKVEESPKVEPPRQSMPDPQIIISFEKWAKDAAYISSTYEGKGGDYANVTGNFDGAGLTCGLLGLTWQYGNQVKIIDEFLIKYGQKKLLSYMPKTGREYLEAVNAGETQGFAIVAAWSNGKAKVNEPYRSELSAFWASPEMIELQDKTYDKMMGIFAKKKCLETQDFFKLDLPKFEHYAYWWDQAVLNGQGKTIDFKEANGVSIEDVLYFCKNVQGYNTKSMALNYLTWKEQVKKASTEQLYLFKMAYLRAQKSRSVFQGTTMMRRGTLALGVGYVNDDFRSYIWKK